MLNYITDFLFAHFSERQMICSIVTGDASWALVWSLSVFLSTSSSGSRTPLILSLKHKTNFPCWMEYINLTLLIWLQCGCFCSCFAERSLRRLPHLSSHSSFQCYQCGKSYTRSDSLRRHLQYECGKPAQFQCPFCPKKTHQRYNLVRHIACWHRA